MAWPMRMFLMIYCSNKWTMLLRVRFVLPYVSLHCWNKSRYGKNWTNLVGSHRMWFIDRIRSHFRLEHNNCLSHLTPMLWTTYQCLSSDIMKIDEKLTCNGDTFVTKDSIKRIKRSLILFHGADGNVDALLWSTSHRIRWNLNRNVVAFYIWGWAFLTRPYCHI